MRMLSFANFSEAWLPGPDHTSLALGTVDYSAQALSSAVVEGGIFGLRSDAAYWGAIIKCLTATDSHARSRVPSWSHSPRPLS